MVIAAAKLVVRATATVAVTATARATVILSATATATATGIILAVTARATVIAHNCFGPPFLFVEGLLSTWPTPSSFYLLVEMGLPLHLFPAYML